MSAASDEPEARARPKTARRILVVAVALALAAGAWTAYDVHRARAIWPADMPELSMPPPAIPPHPEALARLDDLIAAGAGLDADHDARITLLDAEDPPSARTVWPPDVPEAQAAIDAFLATGGLALQPIAIDAPPEREFLPLVRAGAVRRVRALRRASDGDLDGAWRDVTDAWTLGHRLAHAGGHLLASMVGLGIEDGALTTAERLLDAGRWSPGAATMAEALDAAAARPSPLIAALTGECLSADALYLRVGRSAVDALDDIASSEGEAVIQPAPPGATTADDTWVYDSTRTRALARQYCKRVIEAAATPASQREPVPEIDLGDRRWYTVGPMLDNPVGRTLLAIATPVFTNYVTRGDRIAYRRRRTRLAIARAAYTAEHGRAPTAPAELIPAHIAAMPVDPFTGEPMPLDPPPPPEVD